jgi:hypothetical protein
VGFVGLPTGPQNRKPTSVSYYITERITQYEQIMPRPRDISELSPEEQEKVKRKRETRTKSATKKRQQEKEPLLELRNGCPVFRPSETEWIDITTLVSRYSKLASSYGCFILVPPASALKIIESLAAPKGVIDKLKIREKKQIITAEQTFDMTPKKYVIATQSFPKSTKQTSLIKFTEWHDAHEQDYFPNWHGLGTTSDLSDSYWEQLGDGPKTIETSYPAIGPSSIIPQTFNMHHKNLQDNILLELKQTMVGINCPETYFGCLYSTFGMHKEDLSLSAVNTLVFGAPKQWYLVKPSDAKVLQAAMTLYNPRRAQHCSGYIQHKQYMLSPALANLAGLQLMKPLQYLGESMITVGETYHWGFNLGVNIAEAWNYGNSEWMSKYIDDERCECELTTNVRLIKAMLE